MPPMVWSPRPGLDRRRQCMHMHANACICIPNPHTTGGETKPHPAPHPTPNKGGGYKDPTQPPTPHPTAGGDTMARGVGGGAGLAHICTQKHPNNRKLRGTTSTFKCAPLFHGFLAPPSDPLPTPPLLCGLRCPRKTESKPSPTGALVLFPTQANERRKKQDKDNTTGGAVLRNQVSEIHSKASWMGWGPHSSPRVHSVRLKRTASRKPPGLVLGPQPTKM